VDEQVDRPADAVDLTDLGDGRKGGGDVVQHASSRVRRLLPSL
jgi:hypothetical protein